MPDDYKLVIVMRKDLNMRAGKMVAQGGHAVEGILEDGISSKNKKAWNESGHKKICVRTDTEEKFFEVLRKVQDAKLQYHLVTDSGLTEFGGVPTKTCFAVGPALSSIIDSITGELTLL